MTSTVKMYKCDFCGRIYGKKEEADNCQMGHVCLDNLKITEVAHLVESQFSTYGYPDIVILENIKKSGSAAKYELIKEGSVEDIY